MLRATLTAVLSCLCAAPIAAAADAADPRSPRLVDVPYVSQSELLCGGAAAAMLMRHAGLRGVYAEDFSRLVDREMQGIAAADLRRALVERGFDVHTESGSPAAVLEHLVQGQPVMALIEDRPGRFHYVVIVGWTGGAVVFHDPARAPFMTASEDRFLRAWNASKRWMLVARATRSALAGHSAPPPYLSPPVPGPDHGEALRAFERQDYRDAIRLSLEALAAAPDDAGAWRLLGASRYLAGESGVALDAWNRAGEPRVDLVRLDGLVRTPHRTVEHLMGLPAGDTLTRGGLARARRRLALLPSRQASNVSYVALPGGLAEVRGAIVEAPLFPSRNRWLVEAARAPLSREIEVPFANIARAGDRFSLAWRFREGQPRVGVTFQAPGGRGGGIWTFRGAWQQERHAAAGGPLTFERREMDVEWTDWVWPRVRLSAGAGISRWDGQGTSAVVNGGIELRPITDYFATSVRARVASAGISFATLRTDTRWQLPLSDSLRALGTTAIGYASAATPPDTWFGAGTGQGRPLMLRAHPLLQDESIAGPAFGRAIAQTSVELQRDLIRRGFVTLGVAGFADAARAWRRADGSTSPLHVDGGVGLRLRLGPGAPSIRLDWARGLRDGQEAWSAGVEVGGM